MPLVTGLRLRWNRGGGSTAVPVRSVMAGTAIAVAALIAAVTFGASLQHLVSHPRLSGWDWDVALVDSQGYGNTNPAATTEILGSDPDVTAWGGAFYGADEFDDAKLPLLGIDPGSRVVPPIREGRMIERPGEIVLGTASMARLHKNVGDTVMSSTGPRRIVGSATLPSIGQVHGDHTSLGVGGIVPSEEIPGYDRNTGNAPGAALPPDYGPNVLFVRFRQGADKAAVTERLNATAPGLADSGGIIVVPVQRSAEIVNADNISGASLLLGIAVAVSALASLAIALTSAVRRRRRDLALLKALGFTRRQLSATVAWQATSTTIVGLLAGIPLGVVLGRLLWVQFAGQLDVLAEPSVPLTAIGVVAAVALAAANALAALPAPLLLVALCCTRRGATTTADELGPRCGASDAHEWMSADDVGHGQRGAGPGPLEADRDARPAQRLPRRRGPGDEIDPVLVETRRDDRLAGAGRDGARVARRAHQDAVGRVDEHEAAHHHRVTSRRLADIGDRDLPRSDVRVIVAVTAEQRATDEEDGTEPDDRREDGQDQRPRARRDATAHNQPAAASAETLWLATSMVASTSAPMGGGSTLVARIKTVPSAKSTSRLLTRAGTPV